MALGVKWKIRDQNSSFLICSVTFNRSFTFNELKCPSFSMGMFPFSLLFIECQSSAITGPGPGPAGDARRRQMRSLPSLCLLSLSPGGPSGIG